MLAAFAYHLNAASPRIQSGRPYSLLRHFRRHELEIAELFPLQEAGVQRRKLVKIWNYLRGKRYLLDRDEELLRGFARQLQAALARTSADFLFSPSTLPLSYLETDIPMTFCADAPFSAMRGYYQAFTDLNQAQIDLAERLEAGVLERTSLAVYPTKWAADFAHHHYGISRDRIAEIPFGANFGCGNSRGDVGVWIDRRLGERKIRLLFVGREWNRKGGDLVVATAEWLWRRGVAVQVDFVGCDPVGRVRDLPFARWHGRLSPNHVEESKALAGLFQEAHFVFVPSRAEAYGMTFCEANAFGVPVLTTATGGIPEIVRNGTNGMAFPLESGPEVYGEWIEENFADSARYAALAESSYQQFATRLNWDAHCRTFIARITERMQSSARPESSVRPVEIRDPATPESPSRPLHIAFVADAYTDPTRISSWSGTPYFALRALERQGVRCTVVRVNERSACVARWANFLWYKFTRRQRYLRDRHPRMLRAFDQQLHPELRKIQPDFVFSMSTAVIAYLQVEHPIAYWVDATFAGMSDFYGSFADLADVSKRDGHRADQEALGRAALAIYSSEWAASTARQNYSVDPQRVHFVNLGANLERSPDADEVATMIREREHQTCRLLFMGVDWHRKGAEQAIAIASALQREGINVRLTIVGCRPPDGFEVPPFVEIVGFLSKQTAEGNRRIMQFFRESHFFVLPTRAEAYGMVFCEASAFGLPSIATQVGGISSIIEHGVTGWLLPLDAPPQEYARLLAAKWKDRQAYELMANACRRAYVTRLNWDAAASRVVALMRQCLRSRPVTPTKVLS